MWMKKRFFIINLDKSLFPLINADKTQFFYDLFNFDCPLEKNDLCKRSFI